MVNAIGQPQPDNNKYYLKYGLNDDPFPVNKIASKLFLTPEVKQHLEKIKAFILERKKLLVVTSSAGGGKTIISHQIKLLRASNWSISLIRANANTTIDPLSQNIVWQALPEKTEDLAPPISQLHKYLEYSSRNNLVPVVIIDDAHTLPFETLEFILQLAELRYTDLLFRIILFADNALMRSLDNPELKEITTDKIDNLCLSPFSREETNEYIRNRLSLSGNIHKYPFSKADINTIFKISGGLPKSINILARQLMQERASPDTAESAIGQFIIGLGTIACIIIGIYFLFFRDQISDKTTDLMITTHESPRALISQGKTMEETKKIPEQRQIEQTLTQEEIEQLLQDTGQTIAVDGSMIDDQSHQDLSEPVIEAYTPEDEPAQQETKTETPTVALTETIETTSPITIKEEIELKLISEDENIYHLKQTPDLLAPVKGPSWFRQQQHQSYVLQLISAREISNLEKLLRGQTETKDQLSGYVKYTPSGKPRYLLFYGIYLDEETAQTAINDLPARLKAVNPWPRTIADIIRELDTINKP